MTLIRKTPFPPSGFPYNDPRVPKPVRGYQFDGMNAGGFDEQVSRIIKWRRANPRLYPLAEPQYLTFGYVANELAEFTCARLGNAKKYCTDGTPPKIEERPMKLGRVSNRPCPECNGPLTDRVCQTCAGYKVIGFYCTTCNKDFAFSPRKR